jgi:hypothetical protein
MESEAASNLSWMSLKGQLLALMSLQDFWPAEKASPASRVRTGAFLAMRRFFCRMCTNKGRCTNDTFHLQMFSH